MSDSPASVMSSFALSQEQLRSVWKEIARRDPDDPYAWAMANRYINGDLPRHIPALVDIARDLHPFVVIQKSAQIGVSEMLVNFALWAADTGYAKRGNVAFFMPTQNQMDDFTQGRIDKALQDSPYFRQRLQPEPPLRKGADRLRLKHLGIGRIYLRGAESRKQIASIDADVVILDEFDQMDADTLDLARKRTASSERGLIRIGSTPRLPEAGINEIFLRSDQRYYYIPCPACGIKQRLRWEENVDRERTCVVCRDCRAPMDLTVEGEWVAHAPGNAAIHGYHLNRLYSPWANIPEMIEASEATTPAAITEFQNSDLGEPFVPPGGQLTIDILDRCRRDYVMPERSELATIMGADVGTEIHVVIRKPLGDEATRAVFIGTVRSFDELRALAARYNVETAVVDALPETHAAREFVMSVPFAASLAYYNRHETGHETSSDNGVTIERLNRVDLLDELFEVIRSGKAELPANARELVGRMKDGIAEYYREMLASTRTLEQDAGGNWVAKYQAENRADHFAHAEAYCLVALKKGLISQWGSIVWGLVTCARCRRMYVDQPKGKPCSFCWYAPQPPG